MGQGETKGEGGSQKQQEKRSAQQSGCQGQACKSSTGQMGESEGGGEEDAVIHDRFSLALKSLISFEMMVTYLSPGC
jgi:hypothetical protein